MVSETTVAGDLELRIPRLRAGRSSRRLLERRRWVDHSLFAVITEAYLHGTSTRKVDDLLKALGTDSGISKSEVPRIVVSGDGGWRWKAGLGGRRGLRPGA